MLQHLDRLGLGGNWEKSKLSPVQSISFLGIRLDSVSMIARLTDCAQSMLMCLKSVKTQHRGPAQALSEAPGADGILIGGYSTQVDAHETASTLAVPPSPQRGVAHWHSLCPSDTTGPTHSQPLERPFRSSRQEFQGIQWLQPTPQNWVGVQCATGMQCRAVGQAPACNGTSTV